MNAQSRGSDHPLVFGYGGGWQSNTALVLAAAGKLPFRTFVFADVGEDSEDPATVEYVKQYARPFAKENGIELITVRRQWQDGREFESILQKIENAPEGKLREPIPVRGQNGMPLSRSCTVDWKIITIWKWCRDNLDTSEDNPAVKGIGYTLDEIGRMNAAKAMPGEILTYPLAGIPKGYDTGLRLRRSDCPRIITEAGLPEPPPSSCWFRPQHRIERWHEMRRTRPDLFSKSVRLERLMNERRAKRGKPFVYLTRFGRPLDEVVRDGVDLLPLADEEGDTCDASGCFT